MHFSIPDTKDLTDINGSSYRGYNIHINGIFHCTVRYKQLHNLHEQLRKEFGSDRLPSFPPKKLLPLSSNQLEERRVALEKYIQAVGQDSRIASSDLLVGFLLSAQQETTCETKHEVNLDVYTMNNYQISLLVLTTDRSEQVLIKVCKHLNLNLEYARFFALFLVRKDNTGDITVIRKLQDFESPYISFRTVREANRIVLRKSYWDKDIDLQLMSDPVALNLLYVQTVSDVERSWIYCSKETRNQLANLQAQLAKKEYLELARMQKHYGFLQFSPCLCDYPHPETKVLISVGDQELHMRVIGQTVREGSFKVTRMRCWRITATQEKSATNSSRDDSEVLELSFEYLMSKDKLQWITVTSRQAILMSVCLQSIVDELLAKRNGRGRKWPPGNRRTWSYMKRDGSSHLISLDEPGLEDNTDHSEEGQNTTGSESFSIKKLQEKFSTVTFKSGKEFIENDAFEGIGDDDL